MLLQYAIIQLTLHKIFDHIIIQTTGRISIIMLYISKSTEIGNSPFALSGRLHTTTAPKLGQEPNDSLDGIKTLTLDRKEPVYIFPQVSDDFSDILIIEKRKRFLKTINCCRREKI